MSEVDLNLYKKNVLEDFSKLKEYYPFSYLTIPPTTKPESAIIRVIAANRELIEITGATEKDFLSDYSKELYLFVPVNYKEEGCDVYGASWVDVNRFKNKDIHFFHDNGRLIKSKYGLKICVGTPESYRLMENVILENVRTAENMLIAYERVMTGASNKLELIAYAHGNLGRKQFQQNRARYLPREVTDD